MSTRVHQAHDGYRWCAVDKFVGGGMEFLAVARVSGILGNEKISHTHINYL